MPLVVALPTQVGVGRSIRPYTYSYPYVNHAPIPCGGVAITSAQVSLVRAVDLANPALLRKYLGLIDIVSQTTYKSHLTHEKW
jgi:hypothetical protein